MYSEIKKWMSLFLELNSDWDFNLQKLRQARNKNKLKRNKRLLIDEIWYMENDYDKAFKNSYQYTILPFSF